MKPVVGYEEYFGIERDGRVYSFRTEKYLKTVVNKKGYVVFATKLGGRKGKTVLLRIHRLVAKAYVPNPDNKLFVNHKDGNKSNNIVENLEWVTSAENMQHAVITGLYHLLVGEANGGAKLTSMQVDYIRANYVPYSKEFGTRALARKFGVKHSCISYVINNHSWKK